MEDNQKPEQSYQSSQLIMMNPGDQQIKNSQFIVKAVKDCLVIQFDKIEADKLANGEAQKEKIEKYKFKNICKNFKMIKNMEKQNRKKYYKFFVQEKYDKPALIIRPKENDDTFYILDQGNALVYTENTTDFLKDQRYLVMGGLRQGECFNDSQFLNQKACEYGVIIISQNSQLLALSRKNCTEITDEISEIYIRASFQSKQRLYKRKRRKLLSMKEEELRNHQNQLLEFLKFDQDVLNQIAKKNKTEKLIAKLRKKKEELLSNKMTSYGQGANLDNNLLGTPIKATRSLKAQPFINDFNPKRLRALRKLQSEAQQRLSGFLEYDDDDDIDFGFCGIEEKRKRLLKAEKKIVIDLTTNKKLNALNKINKSDQKSEQKKAIQGFASIFQKELSKNKVSKNFFKNLKKDNNEMLSLLKERTNQSHSQFNILSKRLEENAVDKQEINIFDMMGKQKQKKRQKRKVKQMKGGFSLLFGGNIGGKKQKKDNFKDKQEDEFDILTKNVKLIKKKKLKKSRLGILNNPNFL